MNIFKDSLALFSLAVVAIWGIAGNPQATATFLSQSLTIEQSIPSLPGEFALNRTQQENIVLINRELSREIKSILTPKQLENFTATLSEGLSLRLALQNLSLSPQQSEQLRQALKSAQIKIQQVLTPEQLDYIKQHQQRHRQQQNNSQIAT